jgi:acetyltransferase-like isoleucine patch superfamily enzyme
MRIIKSLKFRIGKLNPIKYARSLGVQIGDDCKFIGMPNFGSEPYLIRLGNHVEISNDVQFITHDGGTWVLKGLENGSTVLTFRKIVIEDNCFIGAQSIIMGGGVTSEKML